MTRLERMTRAAVVAELLREFPNARTYALDATYTVATPAFLDDWRESFAKRMEAEGLSRNGPLFDCDDFALLAKAEAGLLHMRLARDGQFGGQGIAVGMLCYLQEGAEHRGHAVCIVRVKEGWMAWDPTGKRHGLTWLEGVERESAWVVWI